MARQPAAARPGPSRAPVGRTGPSWGHEHVFGTPVLETFTCPRSADARFVRWPSIGRIAPRLGTRGLLQGPRRTQASGSAPVSVSANSPPRRYNDSSSQARSVTRGVLTRRRVTASQIKFLGAWGRGVFHGYALGSFD